MRQAHRVLSWQSGHPERQGDGILRTRVLPSWLWRQSRTPCIRSVARRMRNIGGSPHHTMDRTCARPSTSPDKRRHAPAPVTPLHHHNMKSDSQSLEVGHIWYEDLTASSAHIGTVYREGPGEVVEIMLYGGVVRENGLQLVVNRRAGKCLESSFDSVHARSSTTTWGGNTTTCCRNQAYYSN